MTAAASGERTGGAPEALLRVAACSVRQIGIGVALTAALVLVALQLRAYTWLALFGALLLPLVGSTLGLRGLMRARWRFARNPVSLWIGVLVLLPLTSWWAARLYSKGLAWCGINAVNEMQVLVAALSLGALMLMLPLWVAHLHARAAQLTSLTQAALSADLRALQAQIEPHFLYNTLANTRYLARNDPLRAVEMLDHLISYLHSALPDMRSPTSSLGREFELAKHYLALMTIRFGERMKVELDCPEALDEMALPPLLLMPLVENAVQHGVEARAGDVAVHVVARRDGDRMVVTVRDNGAGIGEAVLGSGVGLRNVRQRLAALYGEAASFRLRMAANGWTEAELSLPIPSAIGAA
jgi:signal transduction histidine kinase